MSRFLEWFIFHGLKEMGWPRPKGIFRRPHVDALVADVVIQQGTQVIVGLGAGRPDIAVALLADTFAANPWTKESTAALFDGHLRKTPDITENYPEIAPWESLSQGCRLAPYGRIWGWKNVFDDEVGLVRASVATRAAYWGLTNEDRMQAIFDREKVGYEEKAADANQYGLGVSNTYPFESLERFYEHCENFVDIFNDMLPPFPDIPPQLRAMPEIARRLQ